MDAFAAVLVTWLAAQPALAQQPECDERSDVVLVLAIDQSISMTGARLRAAFGFAVDLVETQPPDS